MRLVVKVPVLSAQIAVALPKVSHASRCFTKVWSASLACAEQASDTVTASGKPLDAATTATAAARTRASKTAWRTAADRTA
jgi:hypothetical protein